MGKSGDFVENLRRCRVIQVPTRGLLNNPSGKMRKENLKRKGIDDGDNSGGEENDGRDSVSPAGGAGGEENSSVAAAAPSDGDKGDDEDRQGEQDSANDDTAEENGDTKDAGSDAEAFEDAETGEGGENGDGEDAAEGDKKVSRGRGRPPKKAISAQEANGGQGDDGDKQKENGGQDDGDEDEEEEEEDAADDKNDADSDYGGSPKKAKKTPVKRVPKKKPVKKPTKATPAKKPAKKQEKEEEYEVEDIVDHQRERGGKMVYRIRWKNYGPDDDTWEPEGTLSCPEIIRRYKARLEKEDKAPAAKKAKVGRPAAKKAPVGKKAATPARGRGRPSTGKKPVYNDSEEDDDDDEEEEEQEYEVEKIIDVHYKRNGTREYLVRWKGFTSKDDTWEPADNLSCGELIDKFNEKLDKTKSSSVKELRINRKPTARLTLVEKGRKTSRRNANKSRVNYYDGE